MKEQRNYARHHVGLILALVGLISAATLVLSPARLASAQAAAPSWTYTGNLNEPRGAHTVTLLQNGKVLVAGGGRYDPDSDAAGSTPSAELYDPATGTWSFTGNLNTGRYSHTATLLLGGRVLVVGGVNFCVPAEFCSYPGSAELYDPATGTWSFTGSPKIAFEGHTATLLLRAR